MKGFRSHLHPPSLDFSWRNVEKPAHFRTLALQNNWEDSTAQLSFNPALPYHGADGCGSYEWRLGGASRSVSAAIVDPSVSRSLEIRRASRACKFLRDRFSESMRYRMAFMHKLGGFCNIPFVNRG